MSLAGLVLQFAYRLQRHTRMGWPLARWLGLLLLVVAGWSLFRWWPVAWQSALLIGLFAAYLLILVWAARSIALIVAVLFLSALSMIRAKQ